MFKKISNRAYVIEFSKIGGLLFYSFFTILVWAVNPMNETAAKVVLAFTIFKLTKIILSNMVSFLNLVPMVKSFYFPLFLEAAHTK